MTTFDGSSGHGTATDMAPAPVDTHGFDALTLLKQTADEQIDIKPVTVVAHGGRIRLVCHPDIPERSLRRWQKGALPPEERKNPNPSPLHMSQIRLSTAVLVNTNIRIEVRDRHDPEKWHVAENAATQDPLTLMDKAVLDLFGVMDTQAALIKIFVRESDQIRASSEIMEAAGWAGESGAGGDDIDDPR